MRTFRLIGMTLLMVMLTVNFTACSDDDDDNELSLPVDNTLELLIGTWEGTGEVAGRLFKFNEDYTYSMIIVMKLKMVHLNTSLTDICLLLTIQQLIGEKRIPFTQSLR